MSKKRLDVRMVELGLAESRQKAQAVIMSGQVFVDDKGRTILIGWMGTVEGPETRLEGDDTIITCTMTQDQTAQFQPGEMRLQVNWLDGAGARCATVAKSVPGMEQLLEEVK